MVGAEVVVLPAEAVCSGSGSTREKVGGGLGRSGGGAGGPTRARDLGFEGGKKGGFTPPGSADYFNCRGYPKQLK